MNAKELDVVEMKDGTVGTILEIFGDHEGIMLEITGKKGETIDTPIVYRKNIKKIIYSQPL